MKPLKTFAAGILMAIAMVAVGVAATPVDAQGLAPAATNIKVVNSRIPGEVIITWNGTPGVSHYRIGYVNMERDYPRAKASATGNWREAFIYVDVEAVNFQNGTIYKLSGLQEGAYHAFAVLTNNSRYSQPTWPSDPPWRYLTVSGSGSSDGQDICPITGLNIPEGGYLTVGESNLWLDATFTLDSATLPSTVVLGGRAYDPAEGNKLLRLCSTWNNRTGAGLYFLSGIHNNLATDTGIGFSQLDDGPNWRDNSPVPNGATVSACDMWVIPATATTAVYAIYDSNSANNTVLYQIDLLGN